ncbi:MAG: hypothetical protein V2A71_09755 [Candidatus Eisenbacteria bacterium]
MRFRESSVPLVLVLVTATALLAGCVAREAAHPISTYVIPDYSGKAIKTVALIPMGEHVDLPEACAIALPLLEARASAKMAYVFLSEEEALGRAQKKGISDKYLRMVSEWKKEGTINKENVVSVGKDVAVDALLFTEIYLWNKEWVAPNAEGTSNSQVGMKLVLMGTKTGEKLWEAVDEQTTKSAYYSPQSGIGTHVDEAGMVRSSPVGGVPDPPPIEEAVKRALDAIFAMFP